MIQFKDINWVSDLSQRTLDGAIQRTPMGDVSQHTFLKSRAGNQMGDVSQHTFG